MSDQENATIEELRAKVECLRKSNQDLIKGIQNKTNRLNRLNRILRRRGFRPDLDFRDPNLREGEAVGSGIIVVRRTSEAKRLAPAYFPFEQPDVETAQKVIGLMKSTENEKDTDFEIYVRLEN